MEGCATGAAEKAWLKRLFTSVALYTPEAITRLALELKALEKKKGFPQRAVTGSRAYLGLLRCEEELRNGKDVNIGRLLFCMEGAYSEISRQGEKFKIKKGRDQTIYDDLDREIYAACRTVIGDNEKFGDPLDAIATLTSDRILGELENRMWLGTIEAIHNKTIEWRDRKSDELRKTSLKALHKRLGKHRKSLKAKIS